MLITLLLRANVQLRKGCGGWGEAGTALWLALNNITQRVRADKNITSYSIDIKLKIHNLVVYGKSNVHTKNEDCISIICRDMTILNFRQFCVDNITTAVYYSTASHCTAGKRVSGVGGG